MDRPIFILGYMASGKTTFGRALARRLGKQFVDLDFYISQRFHKTINEIFSDRGEEGFRQIEANMLREVGEMQDIVVACGGGTPCFRENMDYMLERGLTVFLDARIEKIVERLIINRSRRPLMADCPEEELREKVTANLQERMPFYSRAKVSINSNMLETKSEINDTVDNFIKTVGA